MNFIVSIDNKNRSVSHLLSLFYLRVAEALLPGAKFNRYRRGAHTLLRSTSLYSVHEDVYQHLDFGE